MAQTRVVLNAFHLLEFYAFFLFVSLILQSVDPQLLSIFLLLSEVFLQPIFKRMIYIYTYGILIISIILTNNDIRRKYDFVLTFSICFKQSDTNVRQLTASFGSPSSNNCLNITISFSTLTALSLLFFVHFLNKIIRMLIR